MACGSAAVQAVVAIERAPVLCNQLCHSRDEALAAAVASIDLASCTNCGHLYNASFEPERIVYSADYENALHFSARFREYSDELVRSLNARHALADTSVLEVGCGDGDFIKELCAPSGAVGFGYDPSYSGPSVIGDRVHLSNSSFFEASDQDRIGLLCCRHVLEHVEEPREFMTAVANKLEEGSALYLEVPNGLYTLRDLGIWDIIYEHPSYFCAESLRDVVESSGFGDVEVEETFGGQFLSLHARRAGAVPSREPLSAAYGTMIDEFASVYEAKVAEWRGVMAKASAAGGKVAVWGAGSKGSSFLNLLDSEGVVEFIVDINPAKHGKFVAGTGHSIVAPAALRDSAVETVVLMNPLYEREVRAALDALKPTASLLLA